MTSIEVEDQSAPLMCNLRLSPLRVFERDGARVVVDECSLGLISGSTVDFKDEMAKSAFVVADNPNSGQSCGCGTSFTTKD